MLGRNLVKTMLLAAFLCSAVSCGSDDDSKDNNTSATGGDGDTNTGTTDGDGDDKCGPDAANSKASADKGTVTGVIKVADADKAAAKGNLYIVVIKSSEFSTSGACMANPSAPKPAGSFIERCVDLSKDFSYSIPVPPLADDYKVVAFLDVNKNVDPSNPASTGPDACDLISLGADVKVPTAMEVKAADISLMSGSILSSLGCPACKP